MARFIPESDAWRSVVLTGAVIFAVLGARAQWLGEPFRQIVEAAASDRPNSSDADALVLNYYNAIQQRAPSTGGGRSRGGIAGVEPSMEKPEDWIRLEDSEAVQPIDGFLRYELRPHVDLIYRRARLQTNRWGQRDQDYEKTKPAGTVRIALAGDSFSMGSGVEQDQCFEYWLEQNLNTAREAHGPISRYEVINFAVSGYFLFEKLFVIQNKVPEFDPDLILVPLVGVDRHLHTRLAERLFERPDVERLHYDFLKKTVRRAGIQPDDLRAADVLEDKLLPFRDELIDWCFAEMLEFSRRREVGLAILVLHVEPGREPMQTTRWLAERAERSGLTTLRIFDAYRTGTPEAMQLYPFDRHPTPKAHRLLADNIYEALLGEPVTRRLLRNP